MKFPKMREKRAVLNVSDGVLILISDSIFNVIKGKVKLEKFEAFVKGKRH